MSTTQDTFYQTILPAGQHWSFRLRRGRALRLTDSLVQIPTYPIICSGDIRSVIPIFSDHPFQ
ncbi:MAG: hypothetical protein ACMX3H_14000 [Sodalis sp. (in: enterobacteria)]|uniref:hypothetical protein n=1 Tax=Sodalis sp. (in: enterobacteria) TaxID=1898979 RepID=UPI0039E44F0A